MTNKVNITSAFTPYLRPTGKAEVKDEIKILVEEIEAKANKITTENFLEEKKNLIRLISFLSAVLPPKTISATLLDDDKTKVNEKVHITLSGIKKFISLYIPSLNNIANVERTIFNMCTDKESYTYSRDAKIVIDKVGVTELYTSATLRDWGIEQISDSLLLNIRSWLKDIETELPLANNFIIKEQMEKVYVVCLGNDLRRANLQGVDLRMVDLREVALQGADLRGANLSGAQLERAQLQGADLRGADLQGAQLKSTNLSRANLYAANLSQANLEDAILIGANLNQANLEQANLVGSNLSSALLRQANLSQANLAAVEGKGTNFQKAILNGAKLKDAYLKFANFQGCKLEGCILNGVTLKQADLRNANLNNSSLIVANLKEAFLDGATLENTNLAGAILTGIRGDCKVSLFLPNLKDDYKCYLVLSSDESMLKAINSLDDIAIELKQVLFIQLITQLQQENINISRFTVSFEKFLYDNHCCWKEEQVRKFALVNLIKPKYDKAKDKVLTFNDTEVMLLISYLEQANTDELLEYIRNNNCLSNQLIYYGRRSTNDKIKDFCKELEDSYLELKEIKTIREELEQAGLFILGDTFLFKNEDIAIAVSENYYKKFLLNEEVKEVCNWDNMVLLQHGKISQVKEMDLKEVFKRITLFRINYTLAHAGCGLLRLINSLELGSYKSLFETTIGQKYSTKKLLEATDVNQLAEIFKSLVDNNEQLLVTGEEAKSIRINESFKIHLFNLFEEYESNYEKSILLFCFSILFAKYSSKLYFGTEEESQLVLRNLSLAFLNKAVDVDSRVIDPSKFHKWQNRFIGISTDGGFLENFCIDSLSVEMVSYLKEQANEHTWIFVVIIPPAWQ